MANEYNRINEKLLESIFPDIAGNGQANIYNLFRTLAERSDSRIERKSNMSIVDENNQKIDIIKDEIIKIYPIGKHFIYEALITLSQEQDNQDNFIDTFYFLIMITPDNNIFNCDFFDITQISGTNISEDDKYVKLVLEQARQTITKDEDIKAFETFIKIIRQKS